MENNSNKWKGNDVSLSECIENYRMVYKYDGNEFNGWIADSVDENNIPSTFAPFWMDNDSIDDYFDDEGDEIANMCGTTPEEMDYEWKMDALMSYYGRYEFVIGMYPPLSKNELVNLINKEGWSGNLDM